MGVKKCKKIIVVVVVVVLIAFCIVPIEVGLVGGGDDDDAAADDDDVDDDMILITSILLANFQLHMPIQCNHMVSSRGYLVVLTQTSGLLNHLNRCCVMLCNRDINYSNTLAPRPQSRLRKISRPA